MRKIILSLCMAACLMLFAQQVMAGKMYVDQYVQGHNTSWGSYTETGRNTPWGSYSDVNRQDQDHRQNQQSGRNDREWHHDNSGHGNYDSQQIPPQYRYRNNVYQTDDERINTPDRRNPKEQHHSVH
jgi:hypothetical protein